MATWDKIVTEDSLKNATDGGVINASDGDKLLGTDGQDGNAVKKFSPINEWFIWHFGFRGNFYDASGGSRIYLPYQTTGYNWWSYYNYNDVSTAGTMPSSISVGNTVDISATNGYVPNASMGFPVPADCTASNGYFHMVQRAISGTADGDAICRLGFFSGTNGALDSFSTGNTPSTYDKAWDWSINPSGNGNVWTYHSQMNLIGGFAGVDLDGGDNLMPCFQSGATSGTGNRYIHGGVTIMFKLR